MSCYGWETYLVLTLISLSNAYKYEIKTISVPLDHFSFATNKTFEIRYLVNDTYITDTKSPILFYTGNEGDIELFAQNTGFMWEIAPQLGAKLVFAEHRYYGKSLPFGNNSYDSTEHLGYLTSEQALADFSLLLESINPSPSATTPSNRKRPVIAFGGSYGGMLSAWFRMKYPHMVVGAIASSAPILQFTDLTPCNVFNRILTSVFKTAFSNSLCADNVKKSWDVMRKLATTPEGRTLLSQKFELCKPLNSTDDLTKFEEYLTDVYGNIAMMNYPYSTNFIAQLPAYPVREFCNRLKVPLNDTQLIEALQQSLSIYSNSTGKTKCLDFDSAYDSNLGDKGWDFQFEMLNACTEMVMPMCSTKTEMFPKYDWNLDTYSAECFKKFGVRPRAKQATTTCGGFNLDGASNIVFSNGLLDPWSGGGVLRSFNDKVKIMIIPEGAHHLDLRSSNPSDPASVIDARLFELNYIKLWIESYWN